MPNLHRLEVGQPYNPRVRSWPEGTQYNFRGGQHELVLFYPSPTNSEVLAVRKGIAEFALVVEPPLIVLCHRFGSLPWSDSPFDWHRVSAAEQVPPPATEETRAGLRALLTCCLVDATNGILRAIRAVTLSPEFTVALHRAIADQIAARPPGSALNPAFDLALADLYRRYPHSKLLAEAARYGCQGGA